MEVQLFIFIVALLGLRIFPDAGSEENKKIARKKYTILMMVLFVLQSGLRRADVGADTGQYKDIFFEDAETPWNLMINRVTDFFVYNEGKDPIYHVFGKFFAEFIPSYQCFLIFIAILFFWALGRLFYRYLHSNKEILVAIGLYQCLYYSFMSITGCRQTIGTAFTLFAVPYIFEKKWIKVAILLLIAASQHKSALLFGGFLILPYLTKSRLILALGFISYPVMYASGDVIAKYFVQDTIFEQYSQFLEQYDTVGSYVFQAYILLLGACLFWKNKTICQIQNENYVFLNAIAVSIFLTPLTMLDPSNMRIVQYYSVFALLALPMFLTIYAKENKFRPVHYYVFLVFVVYTVMRHFEYHFFWQ